MGDSSRGITRREALKRGAIVGGSVLWLTPVVQTLGMSPALAQPVSKVCTPTTANAVKAYVPGKRNDGSDVLVGRNDPAAALGAADGSFVSLGFGGTLIVKLKNAYFKGNSGSALVVETTISPASYPEELAKVSVSGDWTGGWVEVGVASNKLSGSPPTTTIPLDGIAAVPPVVRYVKLEDDTDQSKHGQTADGFDVDSVGIVCPIV